jgi:hypothetical protein
VWLSHIYIGVHKGVQYNVQHIQKLRIIQSNTILYGDRCTAEAKTEIKQILKYETESFEEKYLGLPVPEGRLKKGKFQATKDKFHKHANDWMEKYSSGGAKDVLIKAVLQAFPTYAMGIFKFPAGLTEELTKVVRDFWWGDEHDRRKMHWLSWDKVAKPKAHGGMGFRDLRVFNQALLARQAWRLIHYPDSLCARIMKAKYYPNGNLLDTAFIQNTSASWQGIMHGLELLKQGAIWRIGDGSQVKIWRDNWLPRQDTLKITGRRTRSRRKWVSELIDPITRSWNTTLVREIFFPHDAETVLKIKLPTRQTEDFVS